MRRISASLTLASLVLAGCAGTNGGPVPQTYLSTAGALPKRSMLSPQFQPRDRRIFSYTHHGDIQSFVVPAGVKQLSIEAAGAQGSQNDRHDGVPGEGGSVKATIAVRPGESLEIRVGGISDGSLGGLGVARCHPHAIICDPYGNGGAGGGSSEVFHGATLLIVAGGGGGAGGVIQTSGGNGGAGGREGSAGSVAEGHPNLNFTGGSGGEGATQIGGGKDGAGGDSGNCVNGNSGSGGSTLAGGNGGDGAWGGGGGGGGGGAGYFGGGGGGGGECHTYFPNGRRNPETTLYYGGGGGGGGSSFAEVSATDVTYVQGGQTGNGRIAITW